MNKCPRCEQPIDPTTTTVCPICGTDLVAAQAQLAQAPAPQPMQPPMVGMAPPPQQPPTPSVGVRRNLAGDIVEEPAPSAPPSYVGGGMPPAQPRPPMPSTPKVDHIRIDVPAKKSSSGGMIALVVVLVAALAGGFWWKSQNSSNPKENTEKFFKAVLSKDYATAYSLLHISDADKSKMASADDLKKTMQTKYDIPGLGQKSQEDINEMANIKIGGYGEPKIDGDKATVNVDIQGSIAGQTFDKKVDIPLVKEGGVWKVGGGVGNLMGAGSMK